VTRPAGAVPVAVALAYAWVAAGLRPFTLPMDTAVAVPVIVVLGISWRRPGPAGGTRAGAEASPLPRRGLAVWIGLVGLLATWQLIAFMSSPRHDHPTLSSIAGAVMGTHPGRAAMFAVWLEIGWVLFLRGPAVRSWGRRASR